ncbi:GATA transcription factor 18 [Glycine soja]|uniref:GATA transcription factor 18 n=1 Tax=Glycine soja TaxID=3848 RepID=A0A445HQV4_GLYSO|nr:GATA transcription factor 18 [Glycine soja]
MTLITPSSSSSVDCTLSLGTPSTRFSKYEEKRSCHERRSVSNFCWDLLQSKHNNPQSHSKSSQITNTTDPVLVHRCANCDTTYNPLWRNGPHGPKIQEGGEKSECSHCRAGIDGVMESMQVYNNSWYAHQQSQKMQCFSPRMGNEFRFMDDADRVAADNGISFLSWRLNVTD